MDSFFATIINHALPGLRVLNTQPLGAMSHMLALSDGRRVVLCLGNVETEAAALRLLAGEIDLPVPELLEADPEGTVGGQPWLLRSYLEGEALPVVINQLNEEQRHQVGQQLGAIMIRVHNLACQRYGVLVGKDPYGATRNDLAYIRLRADAAITACETATALPDGMAAELHRWFSQEYIATGRSAALVHGDLHPDNVLVRQTRSQADGGIRARISGLIGWTYAQGWAPGWDHACLLDSADHPAYFSVRVGYGERYDEANARTAEQVREYAIQPYRLVRYLELLADTDDNGECEDYRRHLAALLRLQGRG